METNYLSYKQYNQLVSFAVRTRSYIVPEDLPIIKLMERCTIYSMQIRFIGYDYSLRFIEDLDKMVNRYYPYGYKENIGFYTGEQFQKIRQLRSVRFCLNIFPSEVRSIEKKMFVRTLRACYKFLTSNYTSEDKQLLIQKLENIRALVVE